MVRRWIGLLVAGMLGWAAPAQGAGHRFEIGESDFLLDGKRLQIRCGELHFARIPREYWRHRLRMTRAMGFNAVCAYVFWNFHEAQPGRFDFTGDRDAAAFCRIAQEEGLWVVLRPGPYVCAEWDLGGFPWWILQREDVRLRTRDPYYLERCGLFLRALGRELAPLEVGRGGPILMVQVENEYGSYGNDREYVGKVRDLLRDAGFSGPFFTCDGPVQLRNDVREDIFSVVNFGGDPAGAFRALRAVRPKGPLMCGEYYPGWFDSWGKRHHRGGVEKVIQDLRYMLENNASFSMYMAHGGTTFGLWSGANSPPYSPQTSSYDYDAPLSEAGWDTPKFHAIRELFSRHLLPGETLPPVPPRNPVATFPAVTLTRCAPLLENLPRPVRDARPRPMELYGQPHGCILYRTTLPPGPAGTLQVREARDWAQVFVDGRRLAVLDRRRGRTQVALPARTAPARLDLLVEAMGRVNYGAHLHDRKGIVGTVTLASGGPPRELEGWDVFNLPLDSAQLGSLRYREVPPTGPAFHRGEFHMDQAADTFLDMRAWGKGVAWVNGRCLGRFWRIGPTQTMYVPGPWLKAGRNEIVVLELDRNEKPVVAGLAEPVLDELREDPDDRIHRKPGQSVRPDPARAVHAGSFADSDQWQEARFARPARGRFVCLETLNAHADSPHAAVAELELLGPGGKPLPRDAWSVAYASSEEVDSGNGSADLVFDLQFTTFWHTQWSAAKPPHPHLLVIDLGSAQEVTGLRYLPRPSQASGINPGRIRDYRVHVSPDPFPGQ